MKKTTTKKTPTKRQQRVSKKIEQNSYLDLTDLKDLAFEADRFHALKVLMEQEGGQVLCDTLISDVVAAMNVLVGHYPSMDRDQLVSMIARMEASLNMTRALYRAADNLEAVDADLEEALRE